MATYIGLQCLSYVRKIQITPASAALQVSRQVLTSYAAPLTAVPTRCMHGVHPAYWKRARRKKARFTKEDQRRLDTLEKHRKDPRAAVIHALKHAGMKIGLPDSSRAITITCTSDVFEAYVPPEGDGKATSLSPEGAKQRLDRVKNAGKAHLSMRKIRKFEPEYTNSEFAWQAQKIFIDAHNALQYFDKNLLHSLLTEKCYPEMVSGNRYKTIRWKYLESIEKPRVVHIRCTDLLHKGNMFGQVTVRMHSKQTLAIYDRFGRLMMGSEEVPKDVLEYVVFEKHLPNRNGAWRMHAKIAPPWAIQREPIIKTMIVPQFEDEDKEEKEEEKMEEEVEVDEKLEKAQS